MAKLVYTTPVTETINEALVKYMYFEREMDFSTFVETGNLIVRAHILAGYNDGSTFTLINDIVLSEVETAAAVSTFFGSSTLAQMEQKILQYAQNKGLLPPGTIS